MLESSDDLTYLTNPAANRLNSRQQVAYKQYRCSHVERLYDLGKNPETVDGYSLTTMDARLSQADRSIGLDEEDRFTRRDARTHGYLESVPYN